MSMSTSLLGTLVLMLLLTQVADACTSLRVMTGAGDPAGE